MDSKPLYDWDQAKRSSNIRDHRVDFVATNEFDWDTAFVYVDDREGYGELREIAIGYISVRLHVLVFTRHEERIRIISLWKAQKSDVRKYVEAFR